ncbi:MAG TPA: GTPase [Candidatus Methanomethylophilaceae archaeon]|nr:GTPase [Candidatus Methanomethylophilaceae archaeon]
MYNVYFIGTAGSGKSTLVRAFRDWLDSRDLECTVINLDPGADAVPYEADIDIREWIHLNDVMTEYSLGPNGAQIVCADLMAVNADKLIEALNQYPSRINLIDTPGQFELFTFRQSSSVIIDALGRERSVLVFLADPTLSRTPNGFVSNTMLCALTQFRFSLPLINMLSKSDMLSEEEVETLRAWSLNPDALYGALLDDDIDSQTIMGLELFKAMENVGVYRELIPVSGELMYGLEDLYNQLQMLFMGGDDPDMVEEP